MLLGIFALLEGCDGQLPQPEGRRGARGAIVDGQVWSVGGEEAGGLSAAVWSYDLGDQRWTRHGDAPVAMAWGAVGWDGAAMLVFAGETPDGPSDGVWRLDPRAESWDPLAPMPVPRSRFGFVISDDTATITGGLGLEGAAYGDAWTFQLGVWNELTTDLGVGGFADPTLVASDGNVFQVGGTIRATNDALMMLGDAQFLAVDEGRGQLPASCGVGEGDGFWLWEGIELGTTWSWQGSWYDELIEAPPPRGYAMCATVSDTLYVLGGDPAFGRESDGAFLQDLWRLRDGQWKQILSADGLPVE